MTSFSLIMAAAANANSVAPPPPPVAGYRVSGGNILTSNNTPFIARGFAVLDDALPNVTTMTSLFPGLTFVSIACGADGTGYSSAQPNSVIEAWVNSVTALGIVCMISDYVPGQPQARTGADLTASCNWYAALAAIFASNPNVWWTTENEVSDNGSGSFNAMHIAIYNAIRGAGNNSLIFMENDTANSGMVPSTYATMTNIGWNIHVYPWEFANLITNQTTLATGDVSGTTRGVTSSPQSAFDTETAGFITTMQSFATSLDGVMPVLMGEGGNSTWGSTIDDAMVSGNYAVCQSIADNTGAGAGKFCGYAYWIYNGYGNTGGDQLVLTTGSTLTTFGVQVAASLKGSTTSSGVPMQNRSLYYLTNVNPASVTPVANDFDIVVVDPTSDGGIGNTFWTTAQVAGMRKNPGGVVVAYFDMGGAENYRFYYAAAKAAGILSATVNSWGENSVQYWSSTWQGIAQSWALKAINSGFDGIYLDVADCYMDPYCVGLAPAAGGFPAKSMSAAGVLEIEFMATLKAYCQSIKPGFQLWENAGEGLSDTTLYGSNPRFVDVIDGALREQVIYLYPGNGNTPAAGTVPIVTDTSYDYDNLIRIIQAGKPVTLTEYVGGTVGSDKANAVGGGTVTDPVLGKVTVAAGSTAAIHWVRQVCAAWNCGYYISVADYDVADGPTLSIVDTDGITVP